MAFALLCFFAHWGLGAVLEAWVDGKRGTSLRNPHSGRDWVHHVYQARPRRDGERLIVLISNSQGYGRDVADEATYAALLQERLAGEGGSAVRVLNWSVPAGKAPELIMLAAAAGRLDPSVVLLVTAGRNFSDWALTRGGRDLPLTRFASDVYQLSAFSDVRSRLPERFRAEYLTSTTLLDALLARGSKLWRLREIPVRLLRPPKWCEAFGSDLRGRDWGRGTVAPLDSARRDLDPDPAAFRSITNRLRPSQRSRRPPGSNRPARSRVRLRLLEDLVAAVPDRSRVVLALMPLRSARASTDPSFAARARQLASDSAIEVWDLSRQVPASGFKTGTHFSASGHLRLAEILVERLGS